MKKLFLIIPCLALVVSCSSIEVNSQASKVLVSSNKPAKGCKYIGEVIGNQGNFFSGAFTSNANLEKGAMNDLRNKASYMGANYVQLITSRAGMSGGSGGSFSQTTVAVVGNAYSCKNLDITE